MSANKVQIYVLILFIIPAVLGYPQFISFGKDGKVGVNFGGYHAEAGLGGLLTGNAAHGGLSASAGTPYGQNAGAGLGGTVDGRTAGGLFAGATAGHGVGASAALAGSIGAEGGAGGSIAESHAAGIQKTVVKLEETAPPVLAVNSQTTIHHEQPSFTVSKAVVGSVGVDSVPQDAGETVVYHKIKTKKKFNTAPVIQPVVQQVVITRPVSSEESSESLSSDSLESHEYGSKSKTKIVSYSHGAGVSAHAHAGGGTFFDGIFNIPIATLTAVNQFLNGKAAAAGGGGGIGYHKSVTITG